MWLTNLLMLMFGENVVSSADGPPTAQELVAVLAAFLSLFQILLFITTTILVLMWVNQMNKNSRELGAAEMQFTSGWAVGWFLVPFANLVKVPQVMLELWKTSKNPMAWKNEPDDKRIHFWWALWVVSGALANISNRYYDIEKAPKELIPNVAGFVGSCLGAAIAGFIFIRLVKDMTAMQLSRRATGIEDVVS